MKKLILDLFELRALGNVSVEYDYIENLLTGQRICGLTPEAAEQLHQYNMARFLFETNHPVVYKLAKLVRFL
jgi:hypothetical protein